MFYGIDLGTTNSVISYGIQIETKDFFKVNSLTNSNGASLTPSVVYFEEESYSVGDNALGNYVYEPSKTIRWVKRKMGSDHIYNIDGVNYTPQSISAMILGELKSYAEKENIESFIDSVVITVPADFDNNAKQATIDAAKIAGFENIHLIPEPNAAILNYIYKNHEIDRFEESFSEIDKYILVFDLGGGTLDISLSAISLNDDKRINARVVTSSGDKYLGGINFDQDIMNYILNKALKIYPKDDIPLNELIEGALNDYESENVEESIRIALAGILSECETCKKQLTDSHSRTLTFFSHERKVYKVDISREEFNGILSPYLHKIKSNINKVLEDAIENTNNDFSSWNDLYKILLVGGSTRIPAIQHFCEVEFNQPAIIDQEIYTSVSRGAAIYGSVIANSSSMINSYHTVIPHDLGIKLNHEFVPILQKGSIEKNIDYAYKVPFSLDTNTPIEIVQKYYNSIGIREDIIIETINYSHPFIFTGDILEIAFSVNDDLVLSVTAKESCIEDEIELFVNDFAKFSDEKIELEIQKVQRGGSIVE